MLFPLESNTNRIYGLNAHHRIAAAATRFYNIGAIGAANAGHHKKFGVLNSETLVGSDGKPIKTPVFSSVYGGCAYFGHYIVRRVMERMDILDPDFKQDFAVNLKSIFKAYSTGNTSSYMNYVKRQTGLNENEAIDVWGNTDKHGPSKLYKVMIAMGRWEAAATSKSDNPNDTRFEAFEATYLGSQKRINETWYGMIHGIYTRARETGSVIEWNDDFEVKFDDNGQPIYVVDYETETESTSRRVWGDTFPNDDYETGERKKDELPDVVKNDSAVNGTGAGSRTMLTGAGALILDFIQKTFSKTGNMDEDTQILIQGIVFMLIVAAGFFFVMKLIRIGTGMVNKK